jgi:hypothetical protein
MGIHREQIAGECVMNKIYLATLLHPFPDEKWFHEIHVFYIKFGRQVWDKE